MAMSLPRPSVPGQARRLVRDPFHHAAVAHEYVGAVIDDVEAGSVELGGQRALGDREPDGVGEPLAQRTGGGLHARREPVLGMTGCFGVQLAKTFDLAHRQIETGADAAARTAAWSHDRWTARIDRGRARPGLRGIEAQMMVPDHLGDVGHAHRHAGMAGVGLLYRVHGQRAHALASSCRVAIVERAGVV